MARHAGQKQETFGGDDVAHDRRVRAFQRGLGKVGAAGVAAVASRFSLLGGIASRCIAGV